MKPSNRVAGPFGKLLAFFFARGQIKRLGSDLHRDVVIAREGLHQWKPDYECLKMEFGDLRRHYALIIPELEADLRRKSKPPLDLLLQARAELSRCDEKLARLKSLSAEWHKRVALISEEAAGLWNRSATIPGKKFAKEIDLKKGEVDAALRNIAACNRKRVEERLNQAGGRLAAMRLQVSEAEELLAGYPTLRDSISSIDDMGVKYDIGLYNRYQSLARLKEQVEASIRNNQYAVGHLLYRNGLKLVTTLQHDLETRQDLVRAEINLWMTDDDISRRFHLNQFPERLSEADGQRWREIRLEISFLIAEKAAATRSQYARLSPTKRNLRFSMAQLDDWETLESFARSAQSNSKYP